MHKQADSVPDISLARKKNGAKGHYRAQDARDGYKDLA